jgi:uncharacterized protein
LIFIDSNIPMYLIGAAHQHKTEAQLLLERLIASGQRLVTDAEVLQEVLHRYTAINQREAIGAAFQLFWISWMKSLLSRKRTFRVPVRLSRIVLRCRLAMPSTSPSWSA